MEMCPIHSALGISNVRLRIQGRKAGDLSTSWITSLGLSWTVCKGKGSELQIPSWGQFSICSPGTGQNFSHLRWMTYVQIKTMNPYTNLLQSDKNTEASEVSKSFKNRVSTSSVQVLLEDWGRSHQMLEFQERLWKAKEARRYLISLEILWHESCIHGFFLEI